MASDILSLVKFCDIDNGLKILNSQSLRWSAPHLFNDPFEPDYRSQPDFTSETLLRGMVKEAISLLFGAREPSGKSNRLVAAIARWREEERFASEDEAETVLHQLLGQMLQQQRESIDKYLQDWQQFASAVRICCFCDKPTNMKAWQVYGGNHSGIALKFSAGEDSALPHPKQVTYTQTPPQITSLKEQVAVMYGRTTAPSSEEFVGKLLTKSRDSNAEREWRCFEIERDPSHDDDQLWYSNKTFKAHELKAVYLGLGISAEDREAVLKVMNQHFKNTRIFQAEGVPGSYAVDFAQVSVK